MRSGLRLLFLGFASLVAAKDGRGRGSDDSYGGGDDHGDASGTSSTSNPIATGAAASSTSSNSTSGLTGGTKCVGSYMCISGIVNGSTVQYTMQSTGKADLGWMALGFGTQMANTPMVIMWPNSDGTLTISQRKAPGEVMPTVDASPPRVASADAAASDLTGTQPKLTFTIPSDGSTTANLIWAFGNTNPGSKSTDASLEQHLDSAATTLDLSQPISSGNGTSDPVSDPNASSGGSESTPLLPFQKMIVAHALLCTIGFLILLPAGALLARYARTFTSGWFQGHWLFQFAIAGPVIVSGVAVGIAAVSSAGAMHLDDDHKRWGIAIFVLYFIQCALGAIVHWIKPTSWTVRKKRPVQNYFHAIVGIIVIGLGFFQVRNGFSEEWTRVSGRPPISNAVNIVWYVWVVLVPVLYLAGLALLPKQFRQERPRQKQAPSEDYAMRPGYTDEPRYSDRQ
ncbi:hypothetical protein C8T65DRAFT_204648 [Cerioporus squamosus]|nr:hypothetical protein C8T65DRAFT_204648 [Cerioporus squamosus]